jgi:hypothetical protein
MIEPMRRRRFVIAAIVSGLVLAAVIAFVVAWSNRGAEQASIEDAVKQLDKRDRDATADALRPAPGVYVYEGAGTETLSVLGTSQQWGPVLPGLVRRRAEGCWTFKIEYNTNHWQETTYCRNDDVLEEVGGRTFQTFDFVVTSVSDLTTFVCDPPGETIRAAALPGDAWPQSCVGESPERGTRVTAAGTNTFVDVETLEIGGESISTYHYRYDRTLSGDQSGVDVFEMWFRVRDGLPIRFEHDVEVKSPSPVGDVTYIEHGSYLLTSVEPRH